MAVNTESRARDGGRVRAAPAREPYDRLGPYSLGMQVLLDPRTRCSPVIGRRSDAPRPAQPSEHDRHEAGLLAAVGRGDRDHALPELYRRYERRLFGLGIRLLGDRG